MNKGVTAVKELPAIGTNVVAWRSSSLAIAPSGGQGKAAAAMARVLSATRMSVGEPQPASKQGQQLLLRKRKKRTRRSWLGEVGFWLRAARARRLFESEDFLDGAAVVVVLCDAVYNFSS